MLVGQQLAEPPITVATSRLPKSVFDVEIDHNS